MQDSQGRAWRTQSPSCLLTSRGVQIRTTLLRDGEQGDPKSLVLHYPAIRSERAVELSFVNVPVPHARPE